MYTKTYYVYITCNPGKTTFYTGMTNDLERRLHEHYTNRGNSKTFAGKYYCYKLLYFEEFGNVKDAMEREEEIKLLTRHKKLELVKEVNPFLNFITIRF